MKKTASILAAILMAGLASGITSVRADDKHEKDSPKKETDAKPFPSAVCLISGDKLGSMGKPVAMVVEGQEIKLCCKGCLKEYNEDKAGYMKKLAQAEAKAKPYPLKTCVVSGDEFDHGKPYVFAYEDQQVKLCCQDCLKEFKSDSAKFLKKIEKASENHK